MGKIFCTCGHAISFITDLLPFRGEILRDQDDDFFSIAAQELADLSKATSDAEKLAWYERNQYLDLPVETEGKSLIFYFLRRLFDRRMLEIFECESCGRLYVQERTDSDHFVSFSPDEEGYQGVLKSERQEKPAP